MTLLGWRKWLLTVAVVYLLGSSIQEYVAKRQVAWLKLIAGALLAVAVVRAWRVNPNPNPNPNPNR